MAEEAEPRRHKLVSRNHQVLELEPLIVLSVFCVQEEDDGQDLIHHFARLDVNQQAVRVMASHDFVVHPLSADAEVRLDERVDALAIDPRQLAVEAIRTKIVSLQVELKAMGFFGKG